MQQQCDLDIREQVLSDSIKELEKTNKKLAELIVKKEQLTTEIIAGLGHNQEGQKLYTYNTYKIEVKTPFIYSLDKKKYLEQKNRLPEEYNPIKESIAYNIDKRLFDKYISDAPARVRGALSELVVVKPGKASVTVKERTQ